MSGRRRGKALLKAQGEKGRDEWEEGRGGLRLVRRERRESASQGAGEKGGREGET